MSNRYFFVLGKTPQLSRAEIYSVFAKNRLNFSVLEYADQYFMVQTDREIDLKSFFQTLGGSTKAGRVVQEIATLGNSHLISLQEVITLDWASKLFPKTDKKLIFGFSVYGSKQNIPFRLMRSLNKLGVSLKKELLQKGLSGKFITSRKPDLSSVVVGQNKLIERGADICIFLLESKIFIGQTLVVQDYKKYSEKDYGRPSRDAKSGMIPPKLARMMINLARAREDQVLLDPFCGSGTILIESLDLGYQKVWGSDISAEAVAAANQNVTWFLKHFGSKKVDCQIKTCDARKLSQCYPQGVVAAVVTEPYLGPPLKGNEGAAKIQKAVDLLEEIYFQTFVEFKKVVSAESKIVVVVPALLDKRGKIYHLNLEKIKELGFSPQSFPSCIHVNQRGALEYFRPDQHLVREIWIFTR